MRVEPGCVLEGEKAFMKLRELVQTGTLLKISTLNQKTAKAMTILQPLIYIYKSIMLHDVNSFFLEFPGIKNLTFQVAPRSAVGSPRRTQCSS